MVVHGFWQRRSCAFPLRPKDPGHDPSGSNRLLECHAAKVALSFAQFSSFDISAGGLNIPLPKVSDLLRQRVSPMAHLAKKATQDGTFTVYVENRPVAWG